MVIFEGKEGILPSSLAPCTFTSLNLTKIENIKGKFLHNRKKRYKRRSTCQRCTQGPSKSMWDGDGKAGSCQ